MEGAPSEKQEPVSLAARILPAVYLFAITVVAGVIIGHTAVTLVYRPQALSWFNVLAIPLIWAGYTAVKAHFKALEEHTKEEYLEALRRGASPYVITFITVISLIGGLVTGGIYAVDSADRKLAEAAARLSLQVDRSVPTNSMAEADARVAPASKAPSLKAPPVDTPSSIVPHLILKSILGDSTRRTALVNSAVLGEGQSALIKLESGSYMVKCLKIEADKVVLEVEGMTNQVVLSL